MYEEQSKVHFSTYHENPEDHVAVEGSGIPPDEIQSVLGEMEEYGLVDKETEVPEEGHPSKDETATYTLNEKGFDVALSREQQGNQLRTNIGLAVLTGFLVMGSLLQGYSAYLSHDSGFDQSLLVGILLISGAAIISMVGFVIDGDPLFIFKFYWKGFWKRVPRP